MQSSEVPQSPHEKGKSQKTGCIYLLLEKGFIGFHVVGNSMKQSLVMQKRRRNT